MDVSVVVALCLSGWGLGYAFGSVIRIMRKTIETLD